MSAAPSTSTANQEPPKHHGSVLMNTASLILKKIKMPFTNGAEEVVSKPAIAEAVTPKACKSKISTTHIPRMANVNL